MAKNSIRVSRKRDDEKERRCRRRIGGLLKLIGYKCPITDRATLRAEAERKLKEINERKRKIVVDQEYSYSSCSEINERKRMKVVDQECYSSSCSEIKKLVILPSRLIKDECGVKCGRKVNAVNHVNTTQSRGSINPVKVRSYVEKIIRKLGGGGGGGGVAEEEMGLVFEKMLTASDVNKAQGRLLIPFNQVQRRDVFNKIMERENKRVDVYVYDYAMSSSMAEEQQHDYHYYELRLGQWDMKGNQNYALKYHWNQVVKENRLRENMMVQLWWFQVRDGIPCLLLVPVNGGGQTDGGEAVAVRRSGGVIIREPTTVLEGSLTSEDEESLKREREGAAGVVLQAKLVNISSSHN